MFLIIAHCQAQTLQVHGLLQWHQIANVSIFACLCPKFHITRLSFFSRVETGLPATVTSLLDTWSKIENFQFHHQELEIVISFHWPETRNLRHLWPKNVENLFLFFCICWCNCLASCIFLKLHRKILFFVLVDFISHHLNLPIIPIWVHKWIF